MPWYVNNISSRLSRIVPGPDVVLAVSRKEVVSPTRSGNYCHVRGRKVILVGHEEITWLFAFPSNAIEQTKKFSRDGSSVRKPRRLVHWEGTEQGKNVGYYDGFEVNNFISPEGLKLCTIYSLSCWPTQ